PNAHHQMFPPSRPSSSLQLFSPILPPSQRSTLFPYTTLFRSYNEAIHLDIENDIFALGFKGAVRNGAAALVACRLTDNALFLLGDRKSTRPNSSHVKSSYAVFCLKKKKDEELTQTVTITIQNS